MARYCDSCGTKLPGKGQGFVTSDGKLVCGRSATQRTVMKGDSPFLANVQLPCASALR